MHNLKFTLLLLLLLLVKLEDMLSICDRMVAWGWQGSKMRVSSGMPYCALLSFYLTCTLVHGGDDYTNKPLFSSLKEKVKKNVGTICSMECPFSLCVW